MRAEDEEHRNGGNESRKDGRKWEGGRVRERTGKVQGRLEKALDGRKEERETSGAMDQTLASFFGLFWHHQVAVSKFRSLPDD